MRVPRHVVEEKALGLVEGHDLVRKCVLLLLVYCSVAGVVGGC